MSAVCSVYGDAMVLILKIITFCKEHNLEQKWITMCAKFSNIVMANNALAWGVVYGPPYTLKEEIY